LENKTDRRSLLKLIAAGAIGAIASAIKIPKAEAEGETVVVGGEYTTATSRTLIQGNVIAPYGVIEGINTATSGNAYGLYGRSDSTSGTGVRGYAIASSGSAYGLYGRSDSTSGTGVEGLASASSGYTHGVYGQSDSTSGIGVEGYAPAASGTTLGVYGHSNSSSGIGVEGFASAASGSTLGVSGVSDSTSGKGVDGWASAASGSTVGVYGLSSSTSGIGVDGWAGAGSGSTVGVRGRSSSTSGVGVFGLAANAGAKPIVARGVGGQTANLQEWQNNAGTALSAVDANGNLGIGIAAPARQVHLRGNNAVFRMDRDANSSAFILVRTAPSDFNTIWKTFYVGVDASGVNNGEFFIGDVGTNVSGPSAKRLWIDNSGGVHIPNLITGDIALANDFVVTEDEKHGIAFKNDVGEKIAVLDRKGNLHIKGKVIQDL